tara:strand:- start:8235 stop:9158 length:924 start_codon:yes stop_codon:yes gene_type:complete
MENLIYKIKNKFFRFSKEALKLKKPSYEELIKYKSFNRCQNNKLVLSFGAGRCGQNWFSKIFNSHSNWVGTCERFSDLESFYRYITYYNLPIDKEGFFKLLMLVVNRDLSKYNNTLIGSPYFSFGVEELIKKLNPNFIFFNIRNPIHSVESFHKKGWYLNSNYFVSNKGPIIDESNNLSRSFSRIVPNNEYFNEWINLTRIGKITWFWATINKAILDDFKKFQDIDKFFLKLEDIDQNYDFYLRLSSKFNFENKMSEKEFYNIINKAPNKGSNYKYNYKDWNDLEKKEFGNIIDRIFPYYQDIKTNI